MQSGADVPGGFSATLSSAERWAAHNVTHPHVPGTVLRGLAPALSFMVDAGEMKSHRPRYGAWAR